MTLISKMTKAKKYGKEFMEQYDYLADCIKPANSPSNLWSGEQKKMQNLYYV